MKIVRASILWLLLLLFCLPTLAETPVDAPQTKSLEELFEQAQIAIYMGDFETAYDQITQAILLAPDQPDIRCERANMLEMIGDDSGALVDVSYALYLQEDAAAYNQRAAILRRLGRHALALLDHDRAVKIEPSAYSLNNRAMTCIQKGYYSEALEDMDLALAKDPTSILLQTNRAAALNGLGRYDEALAVVEQVLQQGDDPHPLSLYAAILYNMDRVEDAEEASARCVALGGRTITKKYAEALPKPVEQPKLPDNPTALSQPLFKKAINDYARDFEKAIDVLSQAIAVDPKNAAVFTQRGNCYFMMRNFEAAHEDYAYALSIEHSPMRHTNYANVLMYTGRFEEALVEMHSATQSKPRTPFVFISRGNAYYHLGQYAEALEDYSTALSMDKSDAGIWIYRGDTYMALERYEEALTDYKMAHTIAPYSENVLACIENAEEALLSLGLPIDAEEPEARESASMGGILCELYRTDFIEMLQETGLGEPDTHLAGTKKNERGHNDYYELLPGLFWVDLVQSSGQEPGSHILTVNNGTRSYKHADEIFTTYLCSMFGMGEETAKNLYAQLLANQMETETEDLTEATLPVSDGEVTLTCTPDYKYITSEPVQFHRETP